MKKLALLFLTIFLVFGNPIFAQDTLPHFSLRNVGNNRIVVAWHNRFENIKQISIQRSFDSIRNFKTILTIADPTLPENGYLDTKADNDHMFYRLYILLDRGVFLFSNTKRPLLDTSIARKTSLTRADNPSLVQPLITDDSTFSAPQVNALPPIPNKPKAPVWEPSKYVYSLKDGNIRITLPEDDKKYSIKFFTLHDEFLFELKEIKEKNFKIEKSNFYQSGWFKFELYENDELKEKNRFYLPKEF